MNKERLLKLAAFLERLAPEAFDLDTWRSHCGDDRNVPDEDLWATACGTTGCAVGWACAMPEFQAQGLYWDEAEAAPAMRGLSIGFSGYAVAAEFFGTSVRVARYLFGPGAYEDSASGPTDVAERIRDVTEMSVEQLELELELI